jgi:signal transduction histidine kinase
MFAQMDRRRLSPSPGLVHTEEVLEPIRSLGLYQSERKKEVAFRCLVETPLPVIRTDKTMLVAILENLLGNAFKFTEKGEVALRVRDIGEERKLAFSVSDTGVGIADSDLPIIFDQFRQVDGSPTRRHGGFGLGLNLVKRYLELLNGEIDVTSVLGQGSTFTVRIPHEI